MTRYEYRLKTILPALLAVLSLLALTAPTCLCAHHEVKTAAVSCHGAAHGTASTPEGIAADSDCICIFAERPSATDKSTPVRITKDAVALSVQITIAAPVPTAQIVSGRIVPLRNVEHHSTLSARKYSRGPPA